MALLDMVMLAMMVALVVVLAVRTFGLTLFDKWEDASYFLRLRVTIVGTLSTGSTAVLGTAAQNGTIYTSESFTMGALPAALDGGYLLQLPNVSIDRRNRDAGYLTFTLSENASIYVAYDQSASFLPAWMGGFVPTPYTIASTNPSTPVYRVYQRDVGPGTYTFGGNWFPLNTGAFSNYFVIIRQR